jgi:hypothetical protein
MVGDDTTVTEATHLAAATAGIVLGVDEFSLQLPAADKSVEDEQWLPPHLSLSSATTLQLRRQRQLRNRRLQAQQQASSASSSSSSLASSSAASSSQSGAQQQQSSQQQLQTPYSPPTPTTHGPMAESVLLFSKKFHFGDTSTMDDSSQDPVHFNMIFYQWRAELIQHAWRTTLDEAIKFAGTLFQISFGDHNPDIHKPGFLRSPDDLNFFLAPEYIASVPFAKLERMIYKEHSALRGIKVSV